MAWRFFDNQPVRWNCAEVIVLQAGFAPLKLAEVGQGLKGLHSHKVLSKGLPWLRKNAPADGGR